MNIDNRRDIKQAKKDEKERQKTAYLLIYRADVDFDGKWTNITSLPFNNRNYSVAHPTVSRDGSKLYFASDMPGAYGGQDIFVVDILANGKYSKPRNMGRKVNTLGSEMFPYIDSKNNLYFSSDS
jgi:Tol biopolymer transport system component